MSSQGEDIIGKVLVCDVVVEVAGNFFCVYGQTGDEESTTHFDLWLYKQTVGTGRQSINSACCACC